jgi:hypothetical protein
VAFVIEHEDFLDRFAFIGEIITKRSTR